MCGNGLDVWDPCDDGLYVWELFGCVRMVCMCEECLYV